MSSSRTLLTGIALAVVACTDAPVALDTDLEPQFVIVGSQTVETFIPDFVAFCTSTGQLCDPPFSVSVETGSILQVQYFVRATHCSSVRVHLFVDGIFKATTGFLGWPSAPSPFDVLPLDTGLLDLGPVPPGSHLVSVQGEGQVGGCNAGQLNSWGGSLKVLTSSVCVSHNGRTIRVSAVAVQAHLAHDDVQVACS